MVYHYSDGVLEYEEHFNSVCTLQEILKYSYDADGNVEYLLYKDGDFSNANAFDLYYYVRDAVGNITDLFQIREQSGSSTMAVNRIAAHYEYDPYGNILSVDKYNNDPIGDINPIRYKDYYYDKETGWYQLGSRFYDPEVGRFLNADGYASTGQGISGTNMYAYCGDNPVL
ncbi:MAG TPA: RHS repeat-associated core domain-containing protein [Clostridiales bacterium]|nr:RHS repeat-associated core domain-containing protein [Clostridiales bacterium]